MSKSTKKTQPKSSSRAKQFSVVLENGKLLKSLVETLATIISETEIKVNKKGLYISAMDPSRICILQAEIPRESFDEFKCSSEFKIGLNLEDFDKVMKRASATDKVELKYNTKTSKISIIFSKDNKTRTFRLTELDIDSEEIPMENLMHIEYDAKFTMDPSLLVESIKDAEIYSEILNIHTTADDLIKMDSSGQIGEFELELGTDLLFDHDLSDNCSGSYSIIFLKSIMKLTSITEKFTMQLKTDYPVRIDFELVEGSRVDYFLAPRVEETNFNDEDVDDF